MHKDTGSYMVDLIVVIFIRYIASLYKSMYEGI